MVNVPLAKGATPVPVKVSVAELLLLLELVAMMLWLYIPVADGENAKEAVTEDGELEVIVLLIAAPANGPMPAPTVKTELDFWPLTVTTAVLAVAAFVPTSTFPKVSNGVIVTDGVAYAARPSSRRSANNEVADASDALKLQPYPSQSS